MSSLTIQKEKRRNMIKQILKIIQPIRQFYWWLVRPETRGVRAILVNQDRKILLVRHKYQEGWFLPGGQVSRKESDEDALRRELLEELGVETKSRFEELGVYINTYEYKKDTIVVFVVNDFTCNPKTHFEIEEQKLFDPKMLPKEISPGTFRRIEEWLGKRNINHKW